MTRILLVEDDPAIARNLVLLLHSEGFTVTHAPTRKEAAAVLGGNPFDQALIDIALPDGNGCRWSCARGINESFLLIQT